MAPPMAAQAGGGGVGELEEDEDPEEKRQRRLAMNRKAAQEVRMWIGRSMMHV